MNRRTLLGVIGGAVAAAVLPLPKLAAPAVVEAEAAGLAWFPASLGALLQANYLEREFEKRVLFAHRYGAGPKKISEIRSDV